MGAAQSNGLRVLIVEDNSDTADSLAILLKIRGATVQVARSGPDAVTLAGVGKPDVVLLDFGLATATLPGRLFRWWAYGRRIEAVTGATRWHIDHVAAFCRSVHRIFLDRPVPIV